MKKIRILSMLLAAVLLMGLAAPPAWAASFKDVSQVVQKKEVDARNALLVNMNEDIVYYEKGADEKVYPASITKVMTALLVVEAVERGDLTMDTVITAGSETWDGVTSDSTTQNIQIGEEMTIRDLLYCLMIPSANEAANILAQAVSGTVASFVDLMNDRAAQLGCTGTHFVNPHGMHDSDHYTTCRDIYLIARAALKNDNFRTIVSTDEYTTAATNMSEERHFYNTNGLLTSKKYSGYVLDGCIGIKTGSTSAAGYCLLSAAERDGTILISVVMGAETVVDNAGTHRKQFSESASLLKWGFENFSVHSILETADPVAEVPVTLGVDTDSVLVVPANTLEALMPNDITSEDVTTTIQVVNTVEAPVEKGQILGKMEVYLQDRLYGTIDLVAVNDVEQSVFLARKKAVEDFIAQTWFKAAILLVVIVVLSVVLKLTIFQPKRRYGSRSSRRGGWTSYKGTRRRR